MCGLNSGIAILLKVPIKIMRKKPRLCIIRQYYFPREAHLRRDVKALLENNFEVDIICAREKGEKFKDHWHTASIYRLPIPHIRGKILGYFYEYISFSFLTFVVLTYLYFKKFYKIIEVDTMPDFLIFTTIIPKVFGAKIILYLFENTPKLFAQKYNLSENHLMVKFLSGLERICIKYANRVIITYKRNDNYLKGATILLNVPDEEIFITEENFESHQKKATDAFPAKDFMVIATHSTLTEIYGIQNIIRAVSVLKNRYPKLKCKIIGDGEYKNELLELSRSLNLESVIQFLGYIPFEKIAGELKRADIGIVSIIAEDLLPNKLFEYVALGIPVICANISAIRNYFSEDELLFYNPNDYNHLASSIEWMILNYEEAQKMAKRALIRYRTHYQWQKIKSAYVGIYLQLLNR